MIVTKVYTEPPICEKEILRYAGCKGSDEELLQLLRACVDEVSSRLSYKVCYMELPSTKIEDYCDFGCVKIQSKDLAKNLYGCEKVVLFAATIGVEIDRLIAKYGRISPTKALLFQAIGAERIEALCDAFCEDLEKALYDEKNETPKISLHPRFSPGYGDVPLEIQKEIFQILGCSKRIGLSLNDSLLMSPSKSVTAFVGIERAGNMEAPVNISREAEEDKTHGKIKCATCNNTECAYRDI